MEPLTRCTAPPGAPTGLLELRESASAGKHLLLTRSVPAGTLLLFEAPLVAYQTGQEPASCMESEWRGLLPADGAGALDEFILAHQLLAAGKRGAWCDAYAATAEIPGGAESAAAVEALSASFGVEPGEAARVVRAVASNAFSLDTCLTRIKFGAALFAQAAYLNHSCDPNCVSRRMGGNMAVFALRDLAEGEEATHSYVPLEVLATPRGVRAQHLFFPCQCTRCTRQCKEDVDGVGEVGEVGEGEGHLRPLNEAGGRRGSHCHRLMSTATISPGTMTTTTTTTTTTVVAVVRQCCRCRRSSTLSRWRPTLSGPSFSS